MALTAQSGSVTTCGAANPYDNLPDDQALQACLDAYDWILLEPPSKPGYVGYLVGDTLKIRHDGVLLTSANSPRKATLIAAPELLDSMLRVTSADNYELSFLTFDGNRERRDVRDKTCDIATRNRRNVELSGSGFRVRYVESTRAVCGSGMTIGSARDFQVIGSAFYDNGRQPEEAGGISGLWADGLTVFGCVRSTIRDNAFWDNTDVDLGVNGGASCSVYRNTITHTWKYAFGGLVIGDPNDSGGEFSGNVVSSGFNLLGFGIIVGCHPWGACNGGFASNVSVHDNVATGAVVNLAVDGLNGGTVQNNTMSLPQGTRVLNCAVSANYTAGHFFDLRSLQPGYVNRTYDVGAPCLP